MNVSVLLPLPHIMSPSQYTTQFCILELTTTFLSFDRSWWQLNLKFEWPLFLWFQDSLLQCCCIFDLIRYWIKSLCFIGLELDIEKSLLCSNHVVMNYLAKGIQIGTLSQYKTHDFGKVGTWNSCSHMTLKYCNGTRKFNVETRKQDQT